jgi:hypothetical protein
MLENCSHICGYGISPHTIFPPFLAYRMLLLPTTKYYPYPFKSHFTSLWAMYMEVHENESFDFCNNVQGVSLANEPGISLIILTIIKMSQRNLNTHYRHIHLHFSHNERKPDQISFAISSFVLELLKKCRVR